MHSLIVITIFSSYYITESKKWQMTVFLIFEYCCGPGRFSSQAVVCTPYLRPFLRTANCLFDNAPKFLVHQLSLSYLNELYFLKSPYIYYGSSENI